MEWQCDRQSKSAWRPIQVTRINSAAATEGKRGELNRRGVPGKLQWGFQPPAWARPAARPAAGELPNLFCPLKGWLYPPGTVLAVVAQQLAEQLPLARRWCGAATGWLGSTGPAHLHSSIASSPLTVGLKELI